MSRWHLAKEPEDSDSLYPIRLMEIKENDYGVFVAHFDSEEYAQAVKTAMDWMDSLEDGKMRLTPTAHARLAKPTRPRKQPAKRLK